MRVPFYDIRAQYQELREPLDRAVLDVMASGSYVMGPEHDALEREIAALHQVKHGIAVNSGTDALRIVLDAIGVGRDDEVITTAFTFVASAETIVQTGARPVFVDIDPASFMIDPSKIEAAITSRTKAIMPIHLFGQLADVTSLQKVASRNGLRIVEDAAQAIGSTHDGVPAGNFGIAAAFSFYVTKNLGAAGDAGMIVTNDDQVAEDCRSIRVHGMGRERYYYDHVGYTSRLDAVQAAVLRVKLTRLRAWNDRRAALAAIYDEALRDLDISKPSTLPGNNNTWHQYSVRTPRRDELQAFLKERGVDSMIYYPVPLHYHRPYAHLANGEGSLPHTELVAKQILNLPMHQHLSDDQVRYVGEQVAEFVASATKPLEAKAE